MFQDRPNMPYSSVFTGKRQYRASIPRTGTKRLLRAFKIIATNLLGYNSMLALDTLRRLAKPLILCHELLKDIALAFDNRAPHLLRLL